MTDSALDYQGGGGYNLRDREAATMITALITFGAGLLLGLLIGHELGFFRGGKKAADLAMKMRGLNS